MLLMRRPPYTTSSDTLCPYTPLFRARMVAPLARRRRQPRLHQPQRAPRLARHDRADRPQHRDIEDRDHGIDLPPGGQQFERSEEHTSELQSLMRISYAVFCLKKNMNTHTNHITSHTT